MSLGLFLLKRLPMYELKEKNNWKIFCACILLFLIYGCNPSADGISLKSIYSYDTTLPLNEGSALLLDTTGYQIHSVRFHSIMNQEIPGLLSIPNTGESPHPVIILLHGVGDRKEVDYVEAGHKILIEAGYAVMRIDIYNHGQRTLQDYDFDLKGDYKYWTRDMIRQTVFDLFRTIDYLETRSDIDSNKIGFYGISLGGMIGTIFSGLEKRVGATVITIAGGNLNFIYGTEALASKHLDYLSIIDPINFVEMISPRPLLMINAEDDEVIPPLSSKLLYKKAKEPKEIKWYPATHKTVPLGQVFQDGIDWFNAYL
ncbi:MAG: cephalosporin-C deacetylase-like acetyl esterase [Saprospiraceae bacterium]|jgi:cephalosporin-C deacetylase-like acetyl esterase